MNAGMFIKTIITNGHQNECATSIADECWNVHGPDITNEHHNRHHAWIFK